MDISRNIDKQNKIDLSSESLFVDRISVSRNGIPVINSGSLIIPHGSLISIFGRSGSGKSSLARALFLSMRESGMNVCLLRQRPGPVSSSVVESISLQGIDSIDFSHLLECSNSAGLDSNLLNDSFSSTREVSTLSGGQLQRLDLARTFYSEFEYLILDEFTSALDSNTEIQILENLSTKCRVDGLTVICFSHRAAVKSFSSYSYLIAEETVTCSHSNDMI